MAMLRDELNKIHAEAQELSRLMDSMTPDLCKHRHATMVQASNSDGAWFVTWQCDDCGTPLADRPVTADDIERGDQLPWFDKGLLSRHLGSIDKRQTATAAFFGGKTEWQAKTSN